jgi:hypothetical protein
MNFRPLTEKESRNLACVNEAGFFSALLFITATGLEKSILDAVDPVRRLFLMEGIHDYSAQRQGDDGKRVLPCAIHSHEGVFETTASLYRPRTKRGDPRIWFRHFRPHASAEDVCAIFVHESTIHVLNLTRSDLAVEIGCGEETERTVFFSSRRNHADSSARELLIALKSLAAKGPIRAVCAGPTAVGRSIETALGIRINSSRSPDFKGIEIKSGRSELMGTKTRATLFACVPDWNLSICKSSKEILDRFGYQRDAEFKLYCTISALRPNSQGLVFKIDEANRWLLESKIPEGPLGIAVWRLSSLESSLRNKHQETFWVHASASLFGGSEHFTLTSVVHTKNPNVPQLERLLVDGGVTMDHLIKRTPSGNAKEKGPLFKVARPRIQELFLGAPRKYALA